MESATGRPRGDDIARFWSKVDKNGPIPSYRPDLGPCWLWNGSIFKDTDYGAFWMSDRSQNVLAHRHAYLLVIGTIDGRHLDHLCRVRRCVNPQHLEPTTIRENILRGEGFAAVNHAKTVCDHGHPFDDVNTGRDKRGDRFCRACGIERMRAWRSRKKGA